MGFEPVTRYQLRCDGTTKHGQCDEVYKLYDPDDESEPYIVVLWEEPVYTDYMRRSQFTELRDSWVLLPGDRLMCPRHADAAQVMAIASLSGLPFDEAEEA
jgi:hypothetical protein